ncbi:hypothetical protein Pmani_014808 [Petrolisthes manimaculis]|uniref:BZIP domain-containing protein n=1 Tax=Petrolisthes manimaculis TaxID=1843537 RepID=A0AAE1PV19_9EUCA|nr:hypothetical protein Pmani_014808 [Petrolisthes manimaculis]
MFTNNHQQLYSNTMYYNHQNNGSSTPHNTTTTTTYGMIDDDLLKAVLEDEKMTFPQDGFDVLGATPDFGATGEFDHTIINQLDEHHPLHLKDSFHLLGHNFIESLDQTIDKMHSLDMKTHSLKEEFGSSGSLLYSSHSERSDSDVSDRPASVSCGEMNQCWSVGPNTVSHQMSCSRSGRPRPRRTSTRTAASVAAAGMAQALHDSQDSDSDIQQYHHSLWTGPTLGVSVGDSSVRPRQPRMSHAKLTEEESKERNRTLNNLASRHYREKKVKQLTKKQKKEVELCLQNQKLQRKAEGLQQLRDEMETFTTTYLREHMGGGGGGGGGGDLLPHIPF